MVEKIRYNKKITSKESVALSLFIISIIFSIISLYYLFINSTKDMIIGAIIAILSLLVAMYLVK